MGGQTRRVIVLGSTGSIGVQTLEVIEHLNRVHAARAVPIRYEVVGLAAGRNAALISEQSARFTAPRVAIAGGDGPCPPGALRGPDAPERLVGEVECDLVVAAMSGTAGLPAAFEAVRLGRDVALANKETLVAAGSLILHEAERSGSRLLPVDSEHAALWQCLARQGSGVGGQGTGERAQGTGHKTQDPEEKRKQGEAGAAPPMRVDESVERVWITASGGAFRGRKREDVHDATPEEALKHPTWSMGPKVTIDSATLMNKALEIIEAHWLFGLDVARIGVLIHAQSIVHAIVEFTGGAAIAQMAAADMRGPIQHALAWPHRADPCGRGLNWSELPRLEFQEPDPAQSRAIGLAERAVRAGGTGGAILNGANEAAVRAFLERRIPFGRIVEMSAAALDDVPVGPLRTLGDALDAGERARAFVERRIA